MESSNWGRKMYLVSPSEFDVLNKKKMVQPPYENRSAADYRSQKNDEKIVSNQTAEKLEKERQKTDFKDLVQPILATSAIPSFTEKEKIKQILLILKDQSNVSISNNELRIDSHRYELHTFINDLLSHKSSFEYDIEPIINAMRKAKINPSLIPNPNIAKLLEGKGQEEGKKDQNSTFGSETDDGDFDDDDDDDDASNYTLAANELKFPPDSSSTPIKPDPNGGATGATGSSPSLPLGAIPKVKSENISGVKKEDDQEDEKKSKKDHKKRRAKDSPGIAKRRSERDTDRPTHYGKGWATAFKGWKRF